MNPDGKKHKANSTERFGITMGPLLRGYLNPQLNIYPLHCELNALTWWENFIVIFNSRKFWENEMPNWKNDEPYFVKTMAFVEFFIFMDRMVLFPKFGVFK